jgi:hypothetical protein
MTLLNITADLTRCATALERIADCLERIAPEPATPIRRRGQVKASDVIEVTNESLWEQQQRDTQREIMGLPKESIDRARKVAFGEED